MPYTQQKNLLVGNSPFISIRKQSILILALTFEKEDTEIRFIRMSTSFSSNKCNLLNGTDKPRYTVEKSRENRVIAKSENFAFIIILTTRNEMTFLISRQ